MATSAMIFKYTPAQFKDIFDINKSKGKQKKSCKSPVCICEKSFLDNGRSAGHQPGKEMSCKTADFS